MEKASPEVQRLLTSIMSSKDSVPDDIRLLAEEVEKTQGRVLESDIWIYRLVCPYRRHR